MPGLAHPAACPPSHSVPAVPDSWGGAQQAHPSSRGAHLPARGSPVELRPAHPVLVADGPRGRPWGQPLGLLSQHHTPRGTIKASGVMRGAQRGRGAAGQLRGTFLPDSPPPRDPGGWDRWPPPWKPKPALHGSASRSSPGCPAVTGLELAPARKVAFLPGSVSVCRGGHAPHRGQALAPGRTGGGGQGSGSSPDEAPGVRSVPVPLPLAGCSRGAFPGHLSLRLCPRQGPLCWLTLLRSSPPVGPRPGCGHSAGTGGRTRLFGLLPEGKEALPGRSKLPVAGGVQAGH